jgi:hypothetical protein
MFKRNLFPFTRKKRSGSLLPPNPTPSGSFAFAGGGTISNPSSWGKWLQNQPAPSARPNHRLHHLTCYVRGFEAEYDISLDLAERWGYALNVGYVKNIDRSIADAAVSSPVTVSGKLLKLAIANPSRYPIAGALEQKFPGADSTPEGYLRDAGGSVIGAWSPAATPSAMLAATNYKLDYLRKLTAAGARIVTIYDGGETGLGVSGSDPAGNYGRDPRVVADKSPNETWVQYISRKKGVQLRQFFGAVKSIVPNRESYVYYVSAANPYVNIPANDQTNWDYNQIFNVGDLPSGSVYYRDYFTAASGMGNDAVVDRAYKSQLTHWTAAVAEQIQNYGQTTSYNFVSGGFGHTTDTGVPIPGDFLMSILSYKGFLKCMYATGQIGGVAGYFSEDADPELPQYTPFNAANPPHWLLQQQALGEVHARFSWLDDYILDGDLLPGIDSHPVKPSLPSYELPTYNKLSIFFIRNSGIRCFVRKLRSASKWLIVLWVPETPNGSTGSDLSIWIRDIPTVEAIELMARGQGSIYTIDRTSGSTVITQQD